MSQERRRFFRINDHINISYESITAEEVTAEQKRILAGDQSVDLITNFDNRINTLLEQCRIQNPVIAELFDLTNKKLNFIVQQMEIDSNLMREVAYSMRQVNISACGIAFAIDRGFPEGSYLKVFLSLAGVQIGLICRVVSCEAEDGEYFIRLDFFAINAQDQEYLIQYVVKRQGTLIKNSRNEE